MHSVGLSSPALAAVPVNFRVRIMSDYARDGLCEPSGPRAAKCFALSRGHGRFRFWNDEERSARSSEFLRHAKGSGRIMKISGTDNTKGGVVMEIPNFRYFPMQGKKITRRCCQ